MAAETKGNWPDERCNVNYNAILISKGSLNMCHKPRNLKIKNLSSYATLLLGVKVDSPQSGAKSASSILPGFWGLWKFLDSTYLEQQHFNMHTLSCSLLMSLSIPPLSLYPPPAASVPPHILISFILIILFLLFIFIFFR